MNPLELDTESLYRALVARDARFDGVFFVGVETTGVYCRPVCPARTPQAARCRFFARAFEAERAGFRACFRCRPEVAPGNAPSDAVPRLVQRALARIDEGALDALSLDALSAELGVSSRHLRRALHAELGASPVALAQSRRLALAKQLLTDATLGMTDVALASGFRSVRRFNEAFQAHFGRAPSALAARARPGGRRGQGSADAGARLPLTLRLDARRPYAHAPLFAFLGARAVAGVERVDGPGYARVVRCGPALGYLVARFLPERCQLELSLSPELLPRVAEVSARVRRLFDLDARIDSIDAQLARAPRLRASVRRLPGVRVPGAFDGFETAVRVILGQQISVAAATTLAGRVAAAFGPALPASAAAPPGLTRAFPSAAELASCAPAALVALGITSRRADTLIALARAVESGSVTLAPGDASALDARLRALPGIGPWSASAIAMRVAHDPDAFPAGDLQVMRALGAAREADAVEAARPLRPFRAYGTMRLWLELAPVDPPVAAREGARPKTRRKEIQP